MTPCDDHITLIRRLYDLPWDQLHDWATPENRACLDTLADVCGLDGFEREMVDAIKLLLNDIPK